MNSRDRSLHQLARRVRLTIGRAILRLVNDATDLQTVQVSLYGNETRSNLERMQEYGFTSAPLPGAEAAVVFVGGSRDHGIVIAVDDRRFRIKSMEPGEVAIYTDEGDFIQLKRGNNIEVQTGTFTINAAEKVVMNTPTVEMNASTGVTMNTPLASVSGDLIDQNGSNSNTMAGMRAIYNNHVHKENEVLGGETETTEQVM